MCERRPTTEFDTAKGPIKVKLFEGEVGWNIPGDTPHFFAWGLKGRKNDRLGLDQLDQIKLNQEYLEWSVKEGCGSCGLRGEICSGLQPKPFELFFAARKVTVNSYEAVFNPIAVKGKSYNEIKKIIKKGANCKPIEW